MFAFMSEEKTVIEGRGWAFFKGIKSDARVVTEGLGSTNMERYFGFASSLSERKMHERGAKFLSRESAVLPKFRLEFSSNWKDDGFGYANIVHDERSEVHGALYACEKGTLASLDREHIHEGNRFRRVIVQVQTKNGEAVNAVAYQANKEFVNKQLKPSEAYLNEILEGEDIIPLEYAEYIRSFKDGK